MTATNTAIPSSILLVSILQASGAILRYLSNQQQIQHCVIFTTFLVSEQFRVISNVKETSNFLAFICPFTEAVQACNSQWDFKALSTSQEAFDGSGSNSFRHSNPNAFLH